MFAGRKRSRSWARRRSFSSSSCSLSSSAVRRSLTAWAISEPARLDHLAGHALAEAVAGFRDLLAAQTVRDLDPDLAGLPVEQRDRAVLQVQVLGQRLERGPGDVAQVEALAKGLAQPVEELEFPGFA